MVPDDLACSQTCKTSKINKNGYKKVKIGKKLVKIGKKVDIGKKGGNW